MVHHASPSTSLNSPGTAVFRRPLDELMLRVVRNIWKLMFLILRNSWTNFEYLWILKLKGSARITQIVYHHFWSFQRFIPEKISINHELSATSSPRPLRTASPHCRSSWLVEWWLIGLTTSHNHFKVKQGTERHWCFLGELEVWKLSISQVMWEVGIRYDKVWGGVDGWSSQESVMKMATLAALAPSFWKPPGMPFNKPLAWLRLLRDGQGAQMGFIL